MDIERLKARVKALDIKIPKKFIGVLILDEGQQIPKGLIDYPNLLVIVDDVENKLKKYQ